MTKVIAHIKQLDEKIDLFAERIKDTKTRFYPTIVGPVLFIIFSIAVLLIMPSQIKIRTDQIITARTFPSMLMFIILASSLALLGKELFKVIRKKPIEVHELELLTEIKALILLGLLILYAVLMQVLGFIGSSVLYSVLMMYYFRVKNWRYYLIVITCAIAIGLIFRHVLLVRLP